jgi:hypothetical protein
LVENALILNLLRAPDNLVAIVAVVLDDDLEVLQNVTLKWILGKEGSHLHVVCLAHHRFVLGGDGHLSWCECEPGRGRESVVA